MSTLKTILCDDTIEKAAAISKAGGAALVLLSPLPGEPGLHEIDNGHPK